MFLQDLFKKYIENTPEKTLVPDRKICLCCLTKAVTRGTGVDHSMKNVYITTRCLKHLFDKKPAEEFLFIVNNLHKVAKFPDRIYNNKKGKRGKFCFVKLIGNKEYLCSLEIKKIPVITFGVDEYGTEESNFFTEEIQIATAFRLRDESYIKKYTLLWSWGNDNPPS